ncbi:MAG TPA: hypothetical protein PKE63_06500 [Lacibacter sp.]|nr:hypothetical protein [Lacibacter sp.]HMO89591.1 hypothetical protein [Lacibacter sp.]HMP86910.1 hypothetical protein [Lacibacter sp.]
MKYVWMSFFLLLHVTGSSQVVQDTLPPATDSSVVEQALRIKNLLPFFTLHVDSSLSYKLEINKDESRYYWYLKNAPVGLRINKDNGTLQFRADKAYFLSGRLKYDVEYKVQLGVQNLNQPEERVDTSFRLIFYSTEIIPSRIRATVVSPVLLEEGDSISFRITCINGSFPIENISFESNINIKNYEMVQKCDDEFRWAIPFDFIKENDTARTKTLLLRFIGTDRFKNQDTTVVRLVIKDAINFSVKQTEYDKMLLDVRRYSNQLKTTFREYDKKVRKNRNTRVSFDMTSASTALGGTVFSSLPTPDQKMAGRIMPSVGVALVPVKEAVSPNRPFEQNAATLVRAGIKRLDYAMSDNALIGERDPDIVTKTNRLKTELKQVQMQLIDVPIAEISDNDALSLDNYFNNPKVNRKYRTRQNR